MILTYLRYVLSCATLSPYMFFLELVFKQHNLYLVLYLKIICYTCSSFLSEPLWTPTLSYHPCLESLACLETLLPLRWLRTLRFLDLRHSEIMGHNDDPLRAGCSTQAEAKFLFAYSTSPLPSDLRTSGLPTVSPVPFRLHPFPPSPPRAPSVYSYNSTLKWF